MVRLRWSILMIGMLILLAPISHAQLGNLLYNPSFEDERYSTAYSNVDVSFNIPNSWSGGLYTTGTRPWENVPPNGYPHTADIKVDGARSYHISRGGGSFTAWIYQVIATTTNTPLEASAWAYLDHTGGGATARVGIDPSGGSNPFSPTVVWGEAGTRENAWNQVRVTATTKGATASIFLFASQTQPSDPNGVYWDNAYAGSPVTIVVPPVTNNTLTTISDVTFTTIARVNVRALPTVNSKRLARLAVNTTVPVLARSQDGQWVQVKVSDTVQGWTNIRFGTLVGNVDSLPFGN